MSDVYDVEKVKSRFMVMKNIYVFREQFPLILAFAIIIHKRQGLSLDCAIMSIMTWTCLIRSSVQAWHMLHCSVLSGLKMFT